MSTTSATTTHCTPATVDGSEWVLGTEPTDELDEDLVRLAALGARDLPLDVDDAIVRFASGSHGSGALLIRNAPIGALPLTPATPESPVDKDLATELALLTVARVLGQPVDATYIPSPIRARWLPPTRSGKAVRNGS